STSARKGRVVFAFAGGVMNKAYRISAGRTYLCRGMCLDPGRRLLFQPSGAADRANPIMRLQGPPALDRGAEALGIEAGGHQAGVARPMLDEAVGDADLQQGQGQALGGEQLGDGGAGAALD